MRARAVCALAVGPAKRTCRQRCGFRSPIPALRAYQTSNAMQRIAQQSVTQSCLCVFIGKPEHGVHCKVALDAHDLQYFVCSRSAGGEIVRASGGFGH